MVRLFERMCDIEFLRGTQGLMLHPYCGKAPVSKRMSCTYRHHDAPTSPGSACFATLYRVGVEVILYVPPRRREACRFVGSEQNRCQDSEIRRQLCVSEVAGKAAVAKKLRKGKSEAIRAPIARRKVSQQMGGSSESDESHSDESRSDVRPRLS